MGEKATYGKIAVDSFMVQIMWALWGLGVILLIYVLLGAVNISGHGVRDFFSSYYHTANIYMLVTGIIAVTALLPYFVRHGVTRRDYFQGAALACLGLAVAITLLFSLITGLEYALTRAFGYTLAVDPVREIHFGAAAINGLLPGLFLLILDAPFVALSSNWWLSPAVFCLNLVTYYLLGMMLGAAFYRYGAPGGLGFILLALALLMVRDLLWGREFAGLLGAIVPVTSLQLPPAAAVAGNVALIGLVLWFIRRTTSRVAIKL